MFLLVFVAFFSLSRCHCPHLAKLNQPEGPAPPAHFPPGDKGWDWDENAAPGSVPEEHFIQTSLVQRAFNDEEKGFARRLEKSLRQLTEQLRREARVTVDNENIDCSVDAGHYRCDDFPASGSYHFLVVEDSSNGAAVYSVDRKHNSKSDGAIEMALLDALSRHSPSPLTVYATRDAEKEIGFVRRLSVKELQSLTAKKAVPLPRRSPLELHLFEAKVLELRSTEGLEDVLDRNLLSFSFQHEFDQALKENPKLVVLFWNNVDSVSVHVFHIWSKLSVVFDQKDVVLAEVSCHKHGSFCMGLGPRDFRTVVAYRDGENVASTDLLGDEEYYDKWIRLVLHGPVIKLEDNNEMNSAKKGQLLYSSYPSVTIGIFSDDSSTAFKHFKIAAERLIGRYVMTYFLKEKSANIITTFRPNEKMKRVDYDGRFDPASLIAFVKESSDPSFIDISNGFSTDALFHQPKPILLFEGNDNGLLEKATGSQEIKTMVLIVKQTSETKISEILKLETKGSVMILFDRDQVSWSSSNRFSSAEEIERWLKDNTLKITISKKEVHPLRQLQIDMVNNKFSKQEIILLPDHTLFQEMHEEHSEISVQSMGGCPFMAGGGTAQNHDEL